MGSGDAGSISGGNRSDGSGRGGGAGVSVILSANIWYVDVFVG